MSPVPIERIVAQANSGDNSFRIWKPAKSVLVLTFTGDISEELGLEFVRALDNVLVEAPGPLSVFADLRKMERYHPSLRLQAVATFLAHSDLVPSIHAYAPEEAGMVLMAVAVANIALGGRITLHSAWEDFEGRLMQAIGEEEGG